MTDFFISIVMVVSQVPVSLWEYLGKLVMSEIKKSVASLTKE